MQRHKFPLVVTIFVLLFLYLPIILLVMASFNESRFGSEWTGFSLKWYARLFQEGSMWTALRNSLVIAISSTLLSTVLGITAALALNKYKSFLQRSHYALIYSPLIVPDILMGISLLLFFVSIHLQLGLFTVFLAHTTFCVSYVTMNVLTRLQSFDNSIVEAAQDLGANSWEVFWKVMVPSLLPGVAAGALLAFTLSIDDFVITFFVAGPGATTLPLYVYSMIKFGSTPLINALSALLLVITFAIVGITQYLLRENKK